MYNYIQKRTRKPLKIKKEAKFFVKLIQICYDQNEDDRYNPIKTEDVTKWVSI